MSFLHGIFFKNYNTSDTYLYVCVSMYMCYCIFSMLHSLKLSYRPVSLGNWNFYMQYIGLRSFRDSLAWPWITFNIHVKYWLGLWILAWSIPETHAQRMALNYISQGLIKAKPTRLCTSCLCPIRGKHTFWCTSCLLTSQLRESKHTSCAVGETKLDNKSEDMRCVILREQQTPAFKEVCPWASETYRLAAFLFYRTLKYSNLHWKYNVNYHMKIICTGEFNTLGF